MRSTSYTYVGIFIGIVQGVASIDHCFITRFYRQTVYNLPAIYCRLMIYITQDTKLFNQRLENKL